MKSIFKVFKNLRRGNIDLRDFDGLLVGAVLGICLITLTAISIISLSYHGIIGKKEYPLYCIFEKGVGLRVGAKVQLNGVNIGQVSEINLMDDNRVKLTLMIDNKYKNNITTTSEVFAARDQNLISERVILFSKPEKRGRVLKAKEVIYAGNAQDIETVLENISSLLAKAENMINTGDDILNMIADSNSTLGSLIGTNDLYKDMDRLVSSLQKMSNDGSKMMREADDLMGTMNTKIPHILNNFDSLSNTAVTYLPAIDTILGSMSQTTKLLKGTVKNANDMLETSGNVLIDIDDKLNKADDIMSAAGNFWLIKRKMPKRKGISNILEDEW